jgi:SMODS and SLOG-associating 2TM effector domain 3
VSTAPAIRDPQDLPALYQGANEQSLDAQRSFLMWSKLRLGSLVVAALGGAIGLTRAISMLAVPLPSWPSQS